MHENDTGSSSVQISILSNRINNLIEHLKTNKKDKHSRRGLVQMVSDRRGHIKYLKRRDLNKYSEVMKEVGLKEK